MINVERLLQDARAKYQQETRKEIWEIEKTIEKLSINIIGDPWHKLTYRNGVGIKISMDKAVQMRLEGRLREWIETEAAIARMTQ